MSNNNRFDSFFPDEDAPANNPGSQKTPAPQRQLALVKKGHRYVFHYEPGHETEILERLAKLARDPSCSLGMFDAAMLSHQVGKRLCQQVDQLLKN